MNCNISPHTCQELPHHPKTGIEPPSGRIVNRELRVVKLESAFHYSPFLIHYFAVSLCLGGELRSRFLGRLRPGRRRDWPLARGGRASSRSSLFVLRSSSLILHPSSFFSWQWSEIGKLPEPIHRALGRQDFVLCHRFPWDARPVQSSGASSGWQRMSQ